MSAGDRGQTEREESVTDLWKSKEDFFFFFFITLWLTLTTLSLLKKWAGGFAVINRWTLCINA